MAIIRHRIPWSMSYAYTEVEMDTSEEGEITDATLTEWANYAKAMEDAAVAMGCGPKEHPMVNEVKRQGAVEAPEMGQVAPPSNNPNVANPCNLCGGETKVETTKTGKRVMKCASGCTDNVNGRQYAHTVRWL